MDFKKKRIRTKPDQQWNDIQIDLCNYIYEMYMSPREEKIKDHMKYKMPTLAVSRVQKWPRKHLYNCSLQNRS